MFLTDGSGLPEKNRQIYLRKQAIFQTDFSNTRQVVRFDGLTRSGPIQAKNAIR